MLGRYFVVKHRKTGILFFFAYDEVDSTGLHIFARHLMEPRDAMRIFFEGTTAWENRFSRFVTTTATDGLMWFWLEENEKVMVISCYRL